MRLFAFCIFNMIVDNNLLQDVLRKFENSDNIFITDVLTSPACEKGQNFVSRVSKVTVRGFKRTKENVISDYKKDLIVKKPESDFFSKDMLTKAFSNEVQAYTKVIPSLNQYFSEDLATPKCIFAKDDVIILEDLQSSGFLNLHSRDSLDLEEVHAVLNEISKFHAASLIMKRDSPETFSELVEGINEVCYDDDGEKSVLDQQYNYVKTCISMIDSIADSNSDFTNVTAALEEISTKIKSVVPNLLREKRANMVINHGDLWINNLLMKNSKAVVLLDLQCIRYTSIAADLSYFFTINLMPALCLNNFENLIEFYLSKLHFYLNEREINLRNEINKEWLLAEMKDFSIFGVVNGVWISSVFYLKQILKNGEIPEKVEMPVEYKIRMRDIILNYLHLLEGGA